MNIKFKCIKNRPILNGKCAYEIEDCNLEYFLESDKMKKNIDNLFKDKYANKEFLVIYDTLTLIFDIEKKLNTFDAYTNHKKWTEKKLLTPKIEYSGVLEISNFNIEDNRSSLTSIPIYEVDYKNNILRIVLIENTKSSYYRIGKDFIIGLNNRRITDIFLSNIKYIY